MARPLTTPAQEPTDDRIVLLQINDNEVYTGLRKMAIHHSGTEKPLSMSFIITNILVNYFHSRQKD